MTFVSLDVYSYLKPYSLKIELSHVFGQWQYDGRDVIKIIYAGYKFNKWLKQTRLSTLITTSAYLLSFFGIYDRYRFDRLQNIYFFFKSIIYSYWVVFFICMAFIIKQVINKKCRGVNTLDKKRKNVIDSILPKDDNLAQNAKIWKNWYVLTFVCTKSVLQ